jgi:hypothetical protein
MPTEKQIAASRANGARSRGPVTPEGKRKSSRNSLRHGMLARTVVLDGESRERFNELCRSLTDELQPATAIENLLVQKMAVAHWRQMRLWNIEKATMALEVSKQPPAEAAGDPCVRDAIAFRSLGDESRSNFLLNQFEMRYDRLFSRSLDRFEKHRQNRSSNVNLTVD